MRNEYLCQYIQGFYNYYFRFSNTSIHFTFIIGISIISFELAYEWGKCDDSLFFFRVYEVN